MSKISFIWIALMIPLFGWAQIDFEVNPSVERIPIGDQFVLELSVKTEPNDEVIWPSIPDSINYGVFIGRSGIDTIMSGEQIRLVENWTFTSFDSGFVVIPPIRLMVNDEPYDSDPILVQVDMPETAGTTYYDIVDPRGLKTPVWKYVLVGIAFLFILLFIVFLIRRVSGKSKETSTSIDLRPYHERITLSLESLEQHASFKTQEDIDLFYKNGTGLLYNYLRNGLAINIAKGQPADWARELTRNKWYSGDATQLIALIEHAQSIRFGHASLSEEDHKAWVKKVMVWIKESKENVEPKKPELAHERVE